MSKIKIYLDNCAFNRPFDDQRHMRIFLETHAKLYIQRLITDKTLVLICSYMSIFENNDNPNEERRCSIANFYQYAEYFVDFDKADEVEKKASEIMKNQIKNKDAIHIACAIIGRCDFFITTDDDIVKKYSGNEIRVCGPIDFINSLEEKNE